MDFMYRSVLKEKRGLSPVIATVLLISITIVLSIIIFLWAKGFVGEKTQKLGEPIENFCDEVDIEAEVVSGDDNLYLTNRGTISLYGFDIRKVEEGSVETIKREERKPLPAGQSESFEVDGLSALSQGEEIIVLPVIVGESGNSKVAYTCDEKYGVKISVI